MATKARTAFFVLPWGSKPEGSKYHSSSYLVAIWAPKVHTILVLGPFGKDLKLEVAGLKHVNAGLLLRT